MLMLFQKVTKLTFHAFIISDLRLICLLEKYFAGILVKFLANISLDA
jgi:hypothetical protein